MRNGRGSLTIFVPILTYENTSGTQCISHDDTSILRDEGSYTLTRPTLLRTVATHEGGGTAVRSETGFWRAAATGQAGLLNT